MAINTFYIESNDAKIFNVGFRPSLVNLATEYNLSVFARNLIKENKIEVIVSGSDDEVDLFYKEVSNPENEFRMFPDDKKYKVSSIEEYNGVEPNWQSQYRALMLEQFGKGVSYIGKNLSEHGVSLTNIQTEFNTLDKKYGKLGEMAEGIDVKLGNIDKSLGDIKGDIKEMTTSVKQLSEALQKIVSDKVP